MPSCFVKRSSASLSEPEGILYVCIEALESMFDCATATLDKVIVATPKQINALFIAMASLFCRWLYRALTPAFFFVMTLLNIGLSVCISFFSMLKVSVKSKLNGAQLLACSFKSEVDAGLGQRLPI